MKLTKLQKAAYLAQARAQYENDEIEIGNPQDGGKNGLRGDTGMFSPDPEGSGSWVRAWVWVSREEMEDSCL